MALYTYHTLQNAADATGDGTAIDLSEVSLGGGTYLALQITGTFVGTITFEGSVDKTNYAAVLVSNSAGSAAATATGTGIFTANVRGLNAFRARVSAYTSGAITIVAQVMWED